MAPQTPQRSERPGQAVALLWCALGLGARVDPRYSDLIAPGAVDDFSQRLTGHKPS
jgi:hypothetical protein